MPIGKTNNNVETAPAPVSRVLSTHPETATRDFNAEKSRRILVQGITQAVAQSMSLAGLGHVTEDAIVKSVENVTRRLVAFVESES